MPKVINICSGEAEDIQQLLPNECLISINEQHGSPWKLRVTGERVLKVDFADVRGVTTHKGIVYNPISVDQAHEIISFIKKWNGYNFYVNCAAGISRSGAVALFMHACFGYELKNHYFRLSEPNPFTLGILISEFYKRKARVYGMNGD